MTDETEWMRRLMCLCLHKHKISFLVMQLISFKKKIYYRPTHPFVKGSGKGSVPFHCFGNGGGALVIGEKLVR